MFRFNKFYFKSALWLLGIEIIIALNVHDSFVRPFGGDVLVVILLYCLVRAFVNTNTRKAALAVFIFSYIVEILQYFKIVEVLGLEHYAVARVVIGTTFAWTDLLAYLLGILIVLFFERLKRTSQLWSTL
jgi:DNA integrity scanning protein DisA with diadenylate cyclase activity